MRETRKSCSRRWAGKRDNSQRWFRDSNRIVVFGARDGSVARKRGRDARARDRSEREFRSRARAGAGKGGASRTRPRPRRRAYRYSRVQIVIIDAFVLVSKKQIFFSIFGFFRLRLQAVIAVFSGCLFYIDTNVRSVFGNSFLGRLRGFSVRPPGPGVIDAVFFRFSSWHTYLLSAEIAPLRSARRQAPRGYPPGRRASPLGAHGVGAAMDRARVASAAEASRARIEEDLGAGESVSERVGRVFAGYRCGTMTVRLERRARAKGPRNAQ